MTAQSGHRDFADALRSALRPGMTVALGDGVGALRSLDGDDPPGAVLSSIAQEIGGIRLVLGWLPGATVGIEPHSFDDVVAIMPGWGVRSILGSRRRPLRPGPAVRGARPSQRDSAPGHLGGACGRPRGRIVPGNRGFVAA